MFLRKGVLKICRKFTGEDPCRSVISIKLQGDFTEIALRNGCSSVNLLHISRTPFPRNTSGWLLLLLVLNPPPYLRQIYLEANTGVIRRAIKDFNWERIFSNTSGNEKLIFLTELFLIF